MKATAAVAASTVVAAGVPMSMNIASAASSGPVQVTMFATPASDVINMNTNWFTKYADKTFNMNIKWIEVPGSDEQTKETLLLESGNYPPVFWGASFTPVQELQYGEEGLFIPLNDLIKKYAPNLEKAINTVPGLRQGMVAPNGNIYGIPAYNWCWHCYYSAKMWINQKDLTKFHLAMPTTTTAFKHVLEVFKQHGLTPLTGASIGPGGGWHSSPITFLMNSFQYDDENGVNSDYFYIDSAGKLGFSPAQPGWYQGLRYIHSLYAAGLMDKGALTQNNTILQREVNNETTGAFPWGCKNCVINNYGTPQSHFNDWVTVPPLAGPGGLHYAAFYGTPTSGATFALTNKSTPAQQEAVMKLVNFLWEPSGVGTQMMDFGPEGKWWTPAKKGQTGLMGTQALFNTNFSEFYNGSVMQNDGWNQLGPMDQSYAWRNGQVAYNPTSYNGSEAMLQYETMKNYAGKQPKLVYPGFVWVPPAQVQQYSMYQANITSYVNQWTDEFIAGGKPLTQADWNTYLQGLDNLGLKQYLQMTSQYMGKPFDTSAYKADPADVTYLEHLKS